MKSLSKINSYTPGAQQGFTLIELLVVIGIIAVLAAIVILAINPARQFRKANDSQRISNVNAILNAIGQYTVDQKGSLPAPITTSLLGIKKTSGADLCALLVPTYIPSFPIDPKTGVDPATDKNDGQISSSECASATYDTGYRVIKDANGRVTVSANGEEPAGTDNISITR